MANPEARNNIPKSNWTTTVTYGATLKLLAIAHTPQTASNNTDYIVTAAGADCKNPYWKETKWNCPSNIAIASTEDSILIRGKSLPEFYEWTVTSALEKALHVGEVTLKLTGDALGAHNSNWGVQFWSKRAGHTGGPTDILIVTTTTAPSVFLNFLQFVTASGTVAGAVILFLTIIRRKEKTSTRR